MGHMFWNFVVVVKTDITYYFKTLESAKQHMKDFSLVLTQINSNFPTGQESFTYFKADLSK